MLGVALIGAGSLLRHLASPSPHGYIEIFFADPMAGLGAMIFAVTVLLNWSHLPHVHRVLGIVALAYGGYVIWSSAHYWKLLLT